MTTSGELFWKQIQKRKKKRADALIGRKKTVYSLPGHTRYLRQAFIKNVSMFLKSIFVLFFALFYFLYTRWKKDHLCCKHVAYMRRTMWVASPWEFLKWRYNLLGMSAMRVACYGLNSWLFFSACSGQHAWHSCRADCIVISENPPRLATHMEYVTYMRRICDIYATYMWHIGDVYVTYIRHFCSIYETYVAYVCISFIWPITGNFYVSHV